MKKTARYSAIAAIIPCGFSLLPSQFLLLKGKTVREEPELR